jgi:AAHS family 4-hydroxybenzoate transporter-like MFS transporter
MGLIGLFLGCGASGMIALASYVYPTTMRSTGIGWAMGMGRLGQVIGPLVTGGLMVRGLAPGAMMQWLAGMPIVAACAALLLTVVLKRPSIDGIRSAMTAVRQA